jgi:hypothetical protein
MVMAAILDIVHGEPERGTRTAGVAYELSRAHNVMLAPITVLHMPDPRGLAVDRLGTDRTDELLEIGAATPLEASIEEILAVAPETLSTDLISGVDATV